MAQTGEGCGAQALSVSEAELQRRMIQPKMGRGRGAKGKNHECTGL
jgi:hypothetical protein